VRRAERKRLSVELLTENAHVLYATGSPSRHPKKLFKLCLHSRIPAGTMRVQRDIADAGENVHLLKWEGGVAALCRGCVGPVLRIWVGQTK
jgi:hypothetical protein